MCAHCGRVCGDADGGYASVGEFTVCHPNAADRPDCYHLVTVYRQPVGLLLPAGGCSVRSRTAGGRWVLCGRDAVHVELFADQCPDDRFTARHEMRLLYCAGHRDLAAGPVAWSHNGL